MRASSIFSRNAFQLFQPMGGVRVSWGFSAKAGTAAKSNRERNNPMRQQFISTTDGRGFTRISHSILVSGHRCCEAVDLKTPNHLLAIGQNSIQVFYYRGADVPRRAVTSVNNQRAVAVIGKSSPNMVSFLWRETQKQPVSAGIGQTGPIAIEFG